VISVIFYSLYLEDKQSASTAELSVVGLTHGLDRVGLGRFLNALNHCTFISFHFTPQPGDILATCCTSSNIIYCDICCLGVLQVPKAF